MEIIERAGRQIIVVDLAHYRSLDSRAEQREYVEDVLRTSQRLGYLPEGVRIRQNDISMVLNQFDAARNTLGQATGGGIVLIDSSNPAPDLQATWERYSSSSAMPFRRSPDPELYKQYDSLATVEHEAAHILGLREAGSDYLATVATLQADPAMRGIAQYHADLRLMQPLLYHNPAFDRYGYECYLAIEAAMQPGAVYTIESARQFDGLSYQVEERDVRNALREQLVRDGHSDALATGRYDLIYNAMRSLNDGNRFEQGSVQDNILEASMGALHRLREEGYGIEQRQGAVSPSVIVPPVMDAAQQAAVP